MWQQIRPLLERLLDQLIDQHRLTTARERLLTLALHAAEIRKLRVPDPYKAKGIKYSDEVIRRKVGKAGGK